MTRDVMTWLREVRKLDGDLLEAMGVRERQHDRLGPVAAFPYRRNGKIYAAKFRTVDKKFLSTQGVSRDLFNLDALSRDQDQPVVITEGEIDCLTVMQAGFMRAVSLPDGWTEEGGKTESLVAAAEAMRQSPYVIVAGDNDKSGESLPAAVCNVLEGHDVRYVAWPDGCKDANDVLIALGEGAVAEALNRAKRVDPPGGVISGFSDLPPMSAQRVLKLGKEPFDKAIALELGEMSVWTGLPGHGKSTLVTWVMDEIAKANDVRIGMIGFETHPARVRDQLARSNYRKPWDEMSAHVRDELVAALDHRWRLVHYNGDADNHLGWLEGVVKTLAVRDRCKVIVLDPWNEMEHLPEPGESMTQYINFALRFIRRLAKKLVVHFVIVAHPAKIRNEGKPRPPTGYDIADSAAFFNKPGLGITVHPGEEEFHVKIINWKTRDTLLYKTERCRIEVEFAPVWGCYRRLGEVAPNDQQALGF